MPKSVARANSVAPGASGVLTQSISLTPQVDPPSTDERPSFWEALYLVPENDWYVRPEFEADEGKKGFKVYIYDTAAGGKYLALLTHPVDIEWVRQNLGGGSYRATLNDPSGKITASDRFSIDGESKRKPVTNVQNAPAAAVSSIDVFQSQVLSILQEGQRKQEALIERLMDRDRGYSHGTPQTPASMNPMEILIPVLSGVVGMFQNMIPKPVNAIDEMLKFKQLMGEPKDIFSELSKLKELGLVGGGAVNAGNGDLLKQLEVITLVAEKFGIGGGGNKSLVESLVEKGPEMLGQVVKGIAEYNSLEQKRLETAKTVLAVQQNARVQQPAQPSPQALPQTRASVSSPNVNQQPGALDVQPIDVPPGAPAAEAAEITEGQINQIKVEIVQAISQGINGADLFGYLKMKLPMFLQGMCKMDASGKVIGIVSVDELAFFCASDSILSQAVNLPRYKGVLAELLEEVRFATMGDDQEEE